MIKALDQLANTVCALEAASAGRLGKRSSCFHGQKRFGSPHCIDSFAAGFGHAGQSTFFLLAQWAQGILLGRAHNCSSSFTPLSLICPFSVPLLTSSRQG